MEEDDDDDGDDPILSSFDYMTWRTFFLEQHRS
jgi:hypothetical protein